MAVSGKDAGDVERRNVRGIDGLHVLDVRTKAANKEGGHKCLRALRDNVVVQILQQKLAKNSNSRCFSHTSQRDEASSSLIVSA